MMHDEQLTQVQVEINALKRQMRQLLEVVALVQQQTGVNREHGGPEESRGEIVEHRVPLAEPSPQPPQSAQPLEGGAQFPGSSAQSPRVSPRSPQPADTEAGAPTPTTPAATGSALAPLYEENGRLIDMLRAQAEELGALRERVRQLEAASSIQRDPRAASLRALLHALHDEL